MSESVLLHMGFVRRDTVQRSCRVDTLAQVRDPDRINQLAKEGMIVKRRGIAIFVFLQTDFEDFYIRHVMRKLTRPDPVLVKNLTEFLTSSDTRLLVQGALRMAVPGAAGGAFEAKVPQLEDARVDIRIWDPVKKTFLDNFPVEKQVFRFRDVIEPTSYKTLNEALRDRKGNLLIPKSEAESLLSMYEESFQKVPVRNPATGEFMYVPKMDYTIDYIKVVQKILLYRADWHGA